MRVRGKSPELFTRSHFKRFASEFFEAVNDGL
jgi:hypothetical protein